jgi:hypothetical protein
MLAKIVLRDEKIVRPFGSDHCGGAGPLLTRAMMISVIALSGSFVVVVASSTLSVSDTFSFRLMDQVQSASAILRDLALPPAGLASAFSVL